MHTHPFTHSQSNTTNNRASEKAAAAVAVSQ